MIDNIEADAASCRSAWTGYGVGAYGWHIHHEKLVEAASEPVENRIAYIKEHKPANEIETRLRLLRPVKDQARAAAYDKAITSAWAAYDKTITSAWAAYDKATASAWAAYDKATAPAWAAYDKAITSAWAAYDKTTAPARAAYDKVTAPAWAAYEALHREECPDCPWDGRTIFPGGAK